MHSVVRSFIKFICLFLVFLVMAVHISPAHADEVCGELKAGDIASMQKKLSRLPVGDRIALWAEAFIGTPYDTDPLGAYVRSGEVVCDSQVDCMYHVFRSVELALTDTPEAARDKALDLRFITRGRVEGGKVVNYDERFQYAEDMIASGKWGRDVTNELGRVEDVPGSRGYKTVSYIPKSKLLSGRLGLKSGDIVYFIKDPSRRAVGEIVGHLGIIKVEGGRASLIHASGSKDTQSKKGCGTVKRVDFMQYVKDMKFIGIKVTRFP